LVRRPLRWKEWIYCKGLMAAKYSTWHELWRTWEKTSNNTFLEYLTCSTDPVTNQSYLRLTIQYEFWHLRVPDNKKRAHIVLLIVAKHAKNDVVLELIFEFLKFNIKLFTIFFFCRRVDQIVILIVIITHEHSVEQFRKVCFPACM